MIKIPIILLAVCAAATVPAFGGKPDVCADTVSARLSVPSGQAGRLLAGLDKL